MKRLLSLLLCAAALLSLSACDPTLPKKSETVEAMDTVMHLELYGVDASALSGIRANAEWYDRALSVTNADGDSNELYRINQNGGGTVSPVVAELLHRTLALCEETGGALDVTVCPVVEEWGFYTKSFRVPPQERLGELLPLVDYRQVSVEGEKVSFGKTGMKLDLGAVAKGHLADEAFRILDQSGAVSGILNLGGTVVAFRKKSDGSLWRVGIADPENSASYMGYLTCEDKIIATSGSYERSFVGEDGKTYSHIIDPKTGIPVDNDMLSVTIISDSGLRCDGLSTALFVMGREKAAKYRAAHPDFDYVILTKDKKAYVTGGVSESFRLTDGSGYEVVNV